MEEISAILKQIIKEKFPEVFATDSGFTVEVTTPPEIAETNNFRADAATNVAMKLAGTLSKQTGKKHNPQDIAETLKAAFLTACPDKSPELTKAQVEIAGPGFLNFMLPDAYFRQKLADLATNFEKNISCDKYKDKVVVTEFSDPNPFKVLHVGHLYTSIVGESISRLIEFAGGTVHRVNFGGDVGLHVAKTLYALQKPDFTIEDIAKAYVAGTRLYEEDETAKTAITKLNQQIYQIAEQNLHDSELANNYWRGRELSYQYFDDFYARIGVKFEKYYPESTVASTGLATVRAHIPAVYQESDSAVVFKGEDYGLHTRVFINQAGLPTYEAKDVGLIFAKDADYHFDESVVITGNDIIEYMKVVLKSVEQYAPELVAKTRHLTHGNVRLPGNEKMSSRKGNFIKAVDVLEMAPLDAIKYSFLKYKIGGNIEFSPEESVSLSGNSGPYLQYSAVRAKHILNKLATPPAAREYPYNDFEIKLLKKLTDYRAVLRTAVEEKAPHLICNFLFELAQEFSRFYEHCQVAGDACEAERAKMVKVFYQIMEHGLNLLSIQIPEEM